MLIEGRGELHHVDGLGADDFGELGVGDNAPLVFGVLKVVGFDILPHFFGHLGAGKFVCGDNGL